jgi:hypothetical protein
MTTVTTATPGSWTDTQWTAGPSNESKDRPATSIAARATAWLNSVERLVRTLASAARQSTANANQSSNSSPAGQLRRIGSLRRRGGMLKTTRRPARQGITSRKLPMSTPPEPARCRQCSRLAVPQPAERRLSRGCPSPISPPGQSLVAAPTHVGKLLVGIHAIRVLPGPSLRHPFLKFGHWLKPIDQQLIAITYLARPGNNLSNNWRRKKVMNTTSLRRQLMQGYER